MKRWWRWHLTVNNQDESYGVVTAESIEDAFGVFDAKQLMGVDDVSFDHVNGVLTYDLGGDRYQIRFFDPVEVADDAPPPDMRPS